MRLKSLLSFLLLGLVAISLAHAPAYAKKSDDSSGSSSDLEIVDTGVTKVDNFYDGVESIITELQAAQADVDGANAELASALGLAEGTPVADALAELAAKADGKVELVMEGTKPTLQASEAVPADVQAGIDATNNMATKLTAAAATLQGIGARVAPMITEAGDMPAAIAESDLGLKDKAVATKNTAANLKTTKEVKNEAATLGNSCGETLGLIKSSFGG